MPTPTPCPDDHILKLFLAHYGNQSGESLLEAHVLQCQQCAERINLLLADDSLIEVMRNARQLPLTESDSALVEGAIKRLTRSPSSTTVVERKPASRPQLPVDFKGKGVSLEDAEQRPLQTSLLAGLIVVASLLTGLMVWMFFLWG